MSLHDYQVRMIEHLRDNPRAGLFAEMGLGKTVTTLHALLYKPAPVLIVAPKRVCETVWEQEATKWNFSFTFSRIMGNPDARRRAVAAKADIYLINVENFVWLRNEYELKWKWRTLVLDESSLFKTPGSKRSRAALWASRRAKDVIILTGTPAPNGLQDLFHQIKILDQGQRLGTNKRKFLMKHFYPENPYYEHSKWLIKDGHDKIIAEDIGDICVSLSSKDYLSLPERIINDIYVDLPPSTLRVYDELAETMYTQIKGADIDAGSAGVLVAKLQQVASGAIYTEDGWESLHDRKLQALDDIIEEAEGQPVLIVYQYRHSIARLKERYPTLHTMDEDKVVDYWNEGKIPLLAVQPASAGHGLNLQYGGHIMVWTDLTWNLELYDQTVARLDRQGQTKPVIVHRLLGMGTIDEGIADALQNKHSVQSMLMGALA